MHSMSALDQIFPINDEEWLELRTKIQTTQDLDYIEWLYDQLGELELQLAYSFHLVEEKWKDIRPTTP